jgi:Skp family chaperone for outer membrane proteins
MRKLYVLLFLSTLSFTVNSQTRGIRIGYIDMEYILQNVPDFTEARNQLELKAQKWKQDIELKQNEINTLKESLKTEKVLLTKELLEEREEEIAFLESELLNFQQQKFGPTGDLIVQKAVLVKPIQDQIFTIVQDIADTRKIDFVFDKSSDLTMLFAAKRHDISDLVIRQMTRASKRQQMSKKDLKELEKKEYEEDLEDENPELAERRKAIEAKQEERQKTLDARKAAAEEKKRAFEEKREQLKAEREAKKNGTVSDKSTTEDKESTEKAASSTDKDTSDAETAEEKRLRLQEEKQKTIDDRKKAIEERKQKILAEREAAKKEREEKQNSQTPKE